MSQSIVDRVVANPGKTASELQTEGEFKNTTRWALFNARRAGKVRQGTPRRCSVTRRQAATWFPVVTQPGTQS